MSLAIGAHIASPYDTVNAATTGGITTTSGSCIIVCVIQGNSSNNPTISDSYGGSWTQIGSMFAVSSSNTVYASVWKNEGGARGAGHTFTATITNGNPSMWVQEVTGTTPYVSGSTTPVADNTGNPISSNSYNNSSADEVVLCFFPVYAYGGTYSFTNSFSATGDELNSESALAGCVATRVVSSLSSYSTSAGLTSPTVWVSGAVVLVGIRESSISSTLNQHSFRFFNDDGSESAATGKATLNTNINLAANDVARIRFLIDATYDPESKQFKLEYRRKPSGGSFGDWLKVN